MTAMPPHVGKLPLLLGGAAIGVAALVAYYVDSVIAWPLGGFLFTITYLLGAGAESAIAYGWDHRG